jgi:tubulin polyglutamylase TTLL6/13
VVQEYLDKPFLIDGLKCDIRLYVLLQSVDPLRAYLFQEGLVRLATKPYVSPSRENLDQLHLHLTNYAINRWSPDFKFNTSLREDHVGHKRSYSALLKLLGDDASARLQEQVA